MKHTTHQVTSTHEDWAPVATAQLKNILATLGDAKEYGYTNVIIGETGSGKSYVCELFARKHEDEVMIIVVSQSDGLNDIFEKICEKAGIEGVKSRSRKLRSIIEHFTRLHVQGKKPMLIFDEAEYMKQPALCAWKELYDHLNKKCALVLVGTNQLTNNLERLRKRNKEGMPQLFRRIKFGIRNLPGIDRSFKQFFEQNEITDKGLQGFLREQCDNYGELHDVLMPAKRESQRTGEPMTEMFVRKILNIR